jgi:hypothetical protein
MVTGSPTDDANPPPERSFLKSKRVAGHGWLLATIALVAWTCFTFPQETLTQLPDPSWMSVLVYAREKGMQFGRDIVFTYGPLGFLSISGFSPSVAVVRIFFEIALGFVIAAGLCLVAWRTSIIWRFVLLGFFICVSKPLHWGGAALFMDLGLFVWGMLCFLESGPRLTIYTLVLAVLAALGAFTKFSFLVMGLFTVGILACDLALRGRRALAAGLVIGFIMAFIVGWMLLGQSPSGIGAFLSTSYGVVSGYNDAMGLSLGNVVWILMMGAATLAAAAIRSMSVPGAGAGPHILRRVILLAWITGLVFVSWKYICVRADFRHLRLLFGFMPLVAICMEALPTANPRAALWSRAAILLCLFFAVIIIRGQILESFFPFTCVRQTCRDLSESFHVLSQPARYLREKT